MAVRRNIGLERANAMLDPNLDWSAATLNGLKVFIAERESIRLKKEAGEPRPWTEDEVLHKTKFTNIYRQHDKTSVFIFDKVKHLDGVLLFTNLVLARLINRVDVLYEVLPYDWCTDLAFLLDKSIMNSKAYQIAANFAAAHDRKTNREVIVYDVEKIAHHAYSAAMSTQNMADAALAANKAGGGCLKFLMFQVIMDHDYLKGSHPDQSTIIVGEGAKAIVDRLGGIASISEELGMQPIDVEHACCEYRKYIYRQGRELRHYSYKPNSMGLTL